MLFLTAKAIHIIGFVSWFAGLFYLVRLFIYHAEAQAKPAAEQALLHPQYTLMSWRLWYIITVPAMFITVIAGLIMVHAYGIPPWLAAKLCLVGALLLYHLQCGRIRRALAEGRNTWTSTQLRMWNEVATLLLVAIVFLAVFKTTFSAFAGAIGILVLGLVMMVAIRLYRKARAA